MVGYKLKCEPGVILITPIGFYKFAQEYFEAAKLVKTIDTGKRRNHPAYFLYARSFELSLKSILLASRIVTKHSIRTLCGHDFDKILELFTGDLKKVVSFKKGDEDTLLILNKWYKNSEKKFEYYDIATSGIFGIDGNKYPNLPNLEALESLGEKMINNSVKSYILGKAKD